MRKVFLVSSANCYPSVADLNLLNAYLKKNGWEISRRIKEAALVVVYTCACSGASEDASIKLIRHAQQKKSRRARLIVCGCLPVINGARLKSVFKGVSVSANSLRDLDAVLGSRSVLRASECAGSGPELKKNNCAEYPLRIGWGCYGKCSYCAIRLVFGRPRSRPTAEIIREFDAAYRKGYRRFVLVANDSGSYGRGAVVSLPGLITCLCRRHGDCKFLLSHITPDRLRALLPSLERLVRSGKILRINVPVQSGSNRIIGLMNRSYRVDDFKYCVEKLTSYSAGIEIKTDIIVGFPAETEDDFLDTLRLVEWLGRNKVIFQFFVYSPRPHTPASSLPGQIDRKTKASRLKRLNRLSCIGSLLRDGEAFAKIKKQRMLRIH